MATLGTKYSNEDRTEIGGGERRTAREDKRAGGTAKEEVGEGRRSYQRIL